MNIFVSPRLRIVAGGKHVLTLSRNHMREQTVIGEGQQIFPFDFCQTINQVNVGNYHFLYS